MRHPSLFPRAVPWITGLILLANAIEHPGTVWAADPPSAPPATPMATPDKPPSAAHDGQPLWLGEGQERFRGIYNEEVSGRHSGAVIILPDSGAQADSMGVVEALRRGLPAYGWITLALDLPASGEPPIKPDAMNTLNQVSAQRLRVAVAMLKQRGINNIIVMGHGLGAALGASYLAQGGDGVAGFVGISMGGPWEPSSDGSYVAELLRKITLPVLDIYGARDLEAVRRSAPGRAATAGHRGGRIQTPAPIQRSVTAATSISRETGDIFYRQVEIPGADHSYSHLEEGLVKRVAGWLRKHEQAALAVRSNMYAYWGKHGIRNYANARAYAARYQYGAARQYPNIWARQPSAHVDRIVSQAAEDYQVDKNLIQAVIQAESAYNPRAVSGKGAYGLMQLMPDTARRYGVQNIFDPMQNVQGGVRYLRDLLHMFGQDKRLALAAYNAGENAVLRYGGIPPYPETADYVIRVLQLHGQYRARG